MALELDWGVHFVGGPLDGRTELYASPDELPRITFLAINDPSDSDGGERASWPTVAIYELSHDATRYHHVRSLPAAESMFAKSSASARTHGDDEEEACWNK